MVEEAIQVQVQQQQLKCPRCESTNTKFCYYNNYSLTQPRHFCKACKRYWTRGGTLRSVPVGGGCRKNKRVRRLHPHLISNSSSSTPNPPPSKIPSITNTLNPSEMGTTTITGSHFMNPIMSSYNGGFSFSDYASHSHHQHELGLGFPSNGYSTRQILQDLISNSNPFSSSILPNTTSLATTMSMPHHISPYGSDLEGKGVGGNGNGLMYLKESGLKLEQIQSGYEIHEHEQQLPMGGSSMLWNNNNNAHGGSIGVNWLDPNYSSIGSSSVPSLI